MALSLRVVLLCVGTSLLLSAPIPSQGQACTFPNDHDVFIVATSIISTSDPGTVLEELLQVHFTCLARVSLDMYTSATVVANVTTDVLPGGTIEQFQLVCMSGTWEQSPNSSFKDSSALPEMPFAIETNDQCSQCEELSMPPQESNYDPDSNCVCEYMYF